MIDQSVIEEIKARNDIVDLISSYVSLKRAGSNMLGGRSKISNMYPRLSSLPSASASQSPRIPRGGATALTARGC